MKGSATMNSAINESRYGSLSNNNTGTQFLLSHEGVTVVRRPRVEQEYATEQSMMSRN
jgi:hypothetical protein